MLIINFESSELPIYIAAIEQYKQSTQIDRLYIFDLAYAATGNILNNYNSLHDMGGDNLSQFWEIFNNIKINIKN